MHNFAKSGFTLVEMVVVVIIIGILAAFVLPRSLHTVENSKARNAVGVLSTVAAAQRMFMEDYPSATPISGQISATASCPASDQPTTPGELIGCRYLINQSWDVYDYDFYLCNPITGTGGSCCRTTRIACAARKSGASSPYDTWGFYAGLAGECYSFGTDNPDCPKI